MSYIPQEGLEALKHYTYTSGGYSVVDLWLNPFWIKLSTWLPLSMAPNTVTLIGTFHLMGMVALTIFFDPKMEGLSPSWVYFLHGWCIFQYSNFDAIDGKQARRTGSSSPLGQLFDHGCDGLASTLIAISLTAALALSGSVSSLLIFSSILAPYFISQWAENHTHVLQTSVGGSFGVTEGQYLAIFVNVVTGIFGADFWKQEFDLPVIGPMEIRYAVSVFGCLFPFILAVSATLSVARSKSNFFVAILMTLPLWLHQTLLYCLQMYEPTSLRFQQMPVIFFLVQGILLSHLFNRIIVSSVCKLPFPVVHKILFPALPLLLMTIWLGNKEGSITQLERNLMDGYMILYTCAILVQYVHFIHSVIDTLTRELNIYCFSLKKRSE